MKTLMEKNDGETLKLEQIEQQTEQLQTNGKSDKSNGKKNG